MIGYMFYVRLPGMDRSQRYRSLDDVRRFLRANYRVDAIFSRSWIAFGVGKAVTMKFVFNAGRFGADRQLVGVVFRKRETIPR